ncbi:hypothetical protein BH10BAC1_BH10BAC1_07750 [soil metagenome]
MNTVPFYFQLGFEHILQLGFDHILFILSLFLLSTNLKSLIWQATAFTVAHSITLALAMYNVISPTAAIVEPIIAISILIVAVQNVFSDKLKRSRIIIVFIFGLVHGMGFAGALKSLGLPEEQLTTALLGFNLGVELGQVTILLIAWYLIGKWFSQKAWYRKRVIFPTSIAIALVALYWTIERIWS